ncbi:LLM class flavin-dependent oxidoreductase [Rhizorhabdus dicambivorans]|uniref:LLM class flavin-dependent oxidoreductase n=1 Tax=Rhizorhabdus dicambivorans TaxID=1850238 RepID=A0A2A4FTT3_9SPHN|nr:LLM class flavin-dependent oxidoreductase [Rhizorhabdus dicambivorans]ATE66296.1 LLM class flavin-dependent oxidoreductase [Rhizorhabdus dicambivorans]PCE41813.1 LLM class flavin-dependent oxidoreductase [Rhizorhabdus dicambivorans]
MIHLVALALPIGAHLGGWRHPDAFHHTVGDLEAQLHMIELAERGKFDAYFLADVNSVKHLNNRELFARNTPTARPGGYEPLTLLSAAAMRTKHIGLVATATTTFEQPYTLARKFASLDLISHGRAGWNIVTSGYPEDANNFGQEVMEHDARYRRATEFVDVTIGLWDSWAPDAFVQDVTTGHFLNPDRVRELNHDGEHFSVKGPLNCARSPQGHTVLFHAGQSEVGRELAAKSADCVFFGATDKDIAKSIYDDIKGRMGKYGRSPEELKMFCGIMAYPGKTIEESDTLIAELDALIPDSHGVAMLSETVEYDLSQHPLDDPMPFLPETSNMIRSVRKIFNDRIRKNPMSIRQFVRQVVPGLGHPIFKGTGPQIAERMIEWHEYGGCDGFIVLSGVAPGGLQNFVDLVIPELQRRGKFRTEYEGTTLRENIGLPMPRSDWD